MIFYLNDAATTPLYTLSLHDALPIYLHRPCRAASNGVREPRGGRAVARRHLLFRIAGQRVLRAARSEEHTSELQSHSDLVCRLLLEKKKECQIGLRRAVQSRVTSNTT